MGAASEPGMNPNGFTTEREVDGERRSIRRYNDGRVSKREANTKSHIAGISSGLNTRNGSIDTSSLPKNSSASKEPGYQAPSAFEVAELHAAIDEIFHPESAGKLPNYKPKIKKPRSPSAVSDGAKTPAQPVASPTPAGSPELMHTEVFSPPVAPRVTKSNPNSISNQWLRLGVDSVYKDLGYD